MPSYPIGYHHEHGCLDTLEVEPSGIARFEGWHRSRSIYEVEFPRCVVNGVDLPVQQTFRTYRPDVAGALGSDFDYHGIACLYMLPPALYSSPLHLTLHYQSKAVLDIDGICEILPPHYAMLLDTTDVLHREHIYSSGPPIGMPATEVIGLVRRLPGPVLDFGCGSGGLVRMFREQNVEAYGIELDRDLISSSIQSDTAPYIKLYDGTFPLPFADNAFQSVIATEVIEHVPDYETALNEIARVVREHFIITVPDISAIPLCHHNSVVPWHLLESTHVNFFTQPSLERLLRRFFAQVEIARICAVTTNGSRWFCNLVGICRK